MIAELVSDHIGGKNEIRLLIQIRLPGQRFYD